MTSIMSPMDRGKVTAFVLLNWSAAFDTQGHSYLLHHFQHQFEVSGSALTWLLMMWHPAGFCGWVLVCLHYNITPLGTSLARLPPKCLHQLTI